MGPIQKPRLSSHTAPWGNGGSPVVGRAARGAEKKSFSVLDSFGQDRVKIRPAPKSKKADVSQAAKPSPKSSSFRNVPPRSNETFVPPPKSDYTGLIRGDDIRFNGNLSANRIA